MSDIALPPTVGEPWSAYERETTVTATDGDDVVHIWTAQRRYITKLRKSPRFTEVASGVNGSQPWAAFTIPARDWNPATGAKRSSGMSAEQRLAAAERIRTHGMGRSPEEHNAPSGSSPENGALLPAAGSAP